MPTAEFILGPVQGTTATTWSFQTSVDWSNKTGDTIWLSWVPESSVPKLHHKYVRRHVDRLARENGLGHVAVKYFGPFDGRYGMTLRAEWDDTVPIGVCPPDMRNTIGLYHELRGSIVPFAIAHEVWHLVQRRRDDMSHGHEECDRYGREYATRFAA